MIYYPNKLELYTHSLRLSYQKLIFKKSITNKILESLRKIYEFEAIISENSLPTDIEKFCSELFTAVMLKKSFDYNIRITGNYIINQKALTSLLLNLAKINYFIEIYSFREKIVIKSKYNVCVDRLVKKIGGTIIKITGKNIVYILLNCDKTEKKTTDFNTAFYHCVDPLSPVNLYLYSQ